MNYDATQLDAELRAAGLRIHGCASEGRIDWVDAPTAAELATAGAVLDAHDPSARQEEQRSQREELARLQAQEDAEVPGTLEDWLSLTPVQRDAATWRGLRIAWLQRCRTAP